MTINWEVGRSVIEESFRRTPLGWWLQYSYWPALLDPQPKDLPPRKTTEIRWFVSGGLLRPPYLPTEGTLEWTF